LIEVEGEGGVDEGGEEGRRREKEGKGNPFYRFSVP